MKLKMTKTKTENKKEISVRLTYTDLEDIQYAVGRLLDSTGENDKKYKTEIEKLYNKVSAEIWVMKECDKAENK